MPQKQGYQLRDYTEKEIDFIARAPQLQGPSLQRACALARMADWLPSNPHLASLGISTDQDLIQKIWNSTAFLADRSLFKARMVKNNQDKQEVEEGTIQSGKSSLLKI